MKQTSLAQVCRQTKQGNQTVSFGSTQDGISVFVFERNTRGIQTV